MPVGGTQLTLLIFCQVFPLPFLTRSHQRAWSDCHILRLVWNFCFTCYLKFDLLVTKLFLNLLKIPSSSLWKMLGKTSRILPNFLNASISSVKSSVNYSCAQLFFSKDYFIFWIVDIYAGCQFHVLYSDLGQVLILLIEKLVRLPCVHLIYVMTENIINANNSKILKLSMCFNLWHY